MLGIIVLTVVWNSRNFDGFFWNSRNFDGFSWNSRKFDGCLEFSEFWRLLWNSRKFDRFFGISGILTVVWNSRNFDGFFGIPGILTDFLEFPEFWRLFGIPGILTDFLATFVAPRTWGSPGGGPLLQARVEVGSGMPSHSRHPGGRFRFRTIGPQTSNLRIFLSTGLSGLKSKIRILYSHSSRKYLRK